MTYDDFIHKLINMGIEAAKADYGLEKGPKGTQHGGHHVSLTEDYNADKLAGSIDGFMECRGLRPDKIGELLADAQKKVHEAFIRVTEKEISYGAYWRVVCRHAEIEWMANCVSAMLVNQGMEPIIPPTARAALTVAKIVGVKEE